MAFNSKFVTGPSCTLASNIKTFKKYQVYHTMKIEESFWEPRYKDMLADLSVPAILRMKERHDSKIFTAEGDGEVLWRMGVSIAPTVSNTAKFKVSLELVSKPERSCVLFNAHRYTYDISTLKVTEHEVYQHLVGPHQTRTTISWNELDLDIKTAREFTLNVLYMKVTEPTTSKVKYQLPSEIMNYGVLSTDFSTLLRDPIASDVTLKAADGKQWKLHKCILAARSRVFAAMFTTDMRENNEGLVDVADVNSETLDLMIKFMYNGDLSDPLDYADQDLLRAADKYESSELMKRCNIMLKSLNDFIERSELDPKLLIKAGKLMSQKEEEAPPTKNEFIELCRAFSGSDLVSDYYDDE